MEITTFRSGGGRAGGGRSGEGKGGGDSKGGEGGAGEHRPREFRSGSSEGRSSERSSEGRSSERSSEGKSGEALAGFQAALERLAEEAVRQAASRLPPPEAAPAAPATDEVRKAVTEAVSAVLLETPVLDRLIEKHLKSSAPAGKGGPARDTGDLAAVVQKEIKGYLGGQDFKEILEEKFRAITLYLKTDVIPKAIRQAAPKTH